MTPMDVFVAVCVLLVGWTGYRLGIATERDRAREREALAVEVAARRAARTNVVQLNTRRGAS